MPLDLNVNNKVPPTNPDDIAASLKAQAKSVYSNMVNTFNRGSKMFWQNPNASPEQIATSLGTDAKELFELHYKLGQLINSVNASDILIGTAIIGQFTMNEDGTVTILPPSGNP